MKVFENKSIFKKLIIVLLCILLLSFCMPKTVSADAEEIGGKLLNPVMSLFVSLGDGAMTLLQKVVFHADQSLINIDTSADFWSKFIVIVAAVAIAAIAIAAVVFTGGGAAVVALGVIKVTLTVGVITTITYPVTTSLVEGMLPDSFYLPQYSITPQEIFSNKIPLLDVDYFNPTDSVTLEDGTVMESTAYALKNTVSSWYTILRDISLVALLSVLIYTGIRILISSTSNDKAKYKQMLIDWIVAICLLFIMHYIMSFSNLIVEKFIDLVDTTQISSDKDREVIEPEMYDISDKDMVKKAYETLVTKPVENGDISSEQNSPYYVFFVDDNGAQAGSKSTRLLWPAENFMQQARINLQILEDDKETYIAIGWKLIYVVLVVFTFIFVFTYLKRLVYMTFLTIIAPLVALTYPIDKMNDGKAQAFNIWFKEYIFNLLIQPMHLILYTVLISSAMDFASENILYVVVALGFMIPAEKLLRKFFGFEKANTPGLLAGPAGAAVMMNGINKLLGKGPKGGKASGGKSSGGKEISDGKDEKIKFKDADAIENQLDSTSVEENDMKLKPGTDLNDEANNSRVGDTMNVATSSSSDSINNQKPQYIEDRISNWASDKKYAAAQKMGEISDSINDNKVVKGAKNIASKTIGRPIRGLKRLPQHSRFVNAGVQGMKKSANYLGNRIKQYNPAKTALNIAKTGAKVYVGGMTGLVAGSIAGIASGDPSKVIQYGAATAIGGYKAVDSIGAGISNVVSDSGFKEAAQKGYYGDDYDQHLIDKKVKEVQNNYEYKEKVLKKFKGDKDKAREFMTDVVPDYVNYGITDMKDIMAAHSLEENGLDRNKAIAVASNVNEYGKNTSKLGAKDSDDLNKTIENRTRRNKKLKTEQEIQKVSKDTRDLMDQYSKIKYAK